MMLRTSLRVGLFTLFAFITLALASVTYSQTAQEPPAGAVEPGSDFQKAHESFLKKDFKASAAEIRKGSDFLKKETEATSDEGKKALTASAQELDKLADSVEKGAVKSDKELKGAFSRAEHALANNYYLKASDSWARKETKETGYALKSAAEHLEQAENWSGHKLEAGTTEAIKEGREVSSKLVQGTGYVAEEVRKGLKDIGEEISRVGKNILPGKK
ncbi:MAG: hypothetical protein M0Z67_11505 [Nitrospiraceae bacterium]|nr:hypothetical protein [Nitrospiraceae bacterium]